MHKSSNPSLTRLVIHQPFVRDLSHMNLIFPEEYFFCYIYRRLLLDEVEADIKSVIDMLLDTQFLGIGEYLDGGYRNRPWMDVTLDRVERLVKAYIPPPPLHRFQLKEYYQCGEYRLYAPEALLITRIQ